MTGHNFLANFKALLTAGNACLNKAFILYSNSTAGIENASFSRLAAFDLSNLELNILESNRII